MAIDLLKVDYDQLDTVAQQFKATAEHMENLTDVVKSAYNPLASGDWLGAAGEAFFREMEHDIFPALTRLSALMHLSSGTVTAVKHDIRQAEEEAAALFNGNGDASKGQSGSGSGSGDASGSGGGSGSSSGDASGSGSGSGSGDGAAPTPAPATPPSPDARNAEIAAAFEDFKNNRPARDEQVDFFPSGLTGTLAGLFGAQSVRITRGEAEMLDRLGPFELNTFNDIKNEAFNTENEYFGTENNNNDGPADAFRHALWSARLAQEYGPDWAKQYTDAHENPNGNPSAREFMDRTNNALGMRIAQEHPGASPDEMAGYIYTAIQNGEGVYIPGANDHSINSSERAEIIETGPLAATNQQLGPNDNLPANPVDKSGSDS